MSKPRYIWWGYVKGMIRKYPVLRDKYADLLTPTLPVDVATVRGGSRAGRPTERIALRELPECDMREYMAVKLSVDQTKTEKGSGDARIRMIRLMYWENSHTMTGAASVVGIAEPTAKRWHGEFIRLVALIMGSSDKMIRQSQNV